MTSAAPFAAALRATLEDLRKGGADKVGATPFHYSVLRIKMPKSRFKAERQAIARYEKAVEAVCRELRNHPLGTLADISIAPMFLCPIARPGDRARRHRPVMSGRNAEPLAVDAFEGIGADEINELAEAVEAWLKAPVFGVADIEAEAEANVRNYGDVLFAM